MVIPKELKSPEFRYTNLKLSENPFKIDPLFRDFRNKQICNKEEILFVPPVSLDYHLQSVCHLKDRRCLIYGGYGVGKTTLVDLVLYLAYNFHNRFCVRVIVTEDNVERAINELLLSLCIEIIEEISYRSMSKPIVSIHRWLLERKFGDTLLTSMAKLIGRYTEEQSHVSKSKKKNSIKVSPGGVGAIRSAEEEIQTRRTIQSFVDVLPMRSIGGYLEDMLAMVEKMGYRDIVIFIDEADHLGPIDEFLRMLTKAREVLFAKGFTFFVAGSPEIARHVEAMGIIFDKTLFLEPTTQLEFEEILTCRIRADNPKLTIHDIFDQQALKAIFETTKGMRKQFIRLAENSLDIAVAKKIKKVNYQCVLEAIGSSKDQIRLTLSASQSVVMKSLAKLGPSSPSEESLQKMTKLKRAALRLVLEELTNQGYLIKEKQGRRSLYTIASTYKPYFVVEK